jgi:hypothetical protein
MEQYERSKSGMGSQVAGQTRTGEAAEKGSWERNTCPRYAPRTSPSVGDSTIMVANNPSSLIAPSRVRVLQWPAGVVSHTRSPQGARP